MDKDWGCRIVTTTSNHSQETSFHIFRAAAACRFCSRLTRSAACFTLAPFATRNAASRKQRVTVWRTFSYSASHLPTVLKCYLQATKCSRFG